MNSAVSINESPRGAGTLYIVATPIGNLGDLSPRAAEVLSRVDFIAAEDTRVTLKLLNHIGVKKPIISCHRHNEAQRIDMIMERIRDGQNCALCSDAGTPTLSDPGEEIVRSAHESGITVIPIPGPAAAVAALSASGLFSGRFCFEGFLPTNRKTRQARLLAIMDEQRTLLFYEAPHKLKNTLRDLLNHLGDRETVVARELTKIHEEIIKTTLSAALLGCEQTEPRGEYVLVVAGKPSEQENEYTMEDAVAMAKALTEDGLSPSAAARAAAKETGFPRSELYRAVIHG